MSGPTLSVLMPNYNHGKYLRTAIEGVLNQTRAPDEFLILDDASTDNSLEIIDSYARRYPVIRVLRNTKNAGVVGAHRRLFEEAKSQYVCTAPADDAHLQHYYEQGMALAAAHPQAGMIFGKIRVIDASDRELTVLGVRRWNKSQYVTPDRFLREYLEVEAPSHSLCGATMYRRDAFREVDWYRPELGSWSDTFAARAIGLKYGACYIADVVYLFRRLLTSYSGQSRANPKRMLDIIGRAARLMRSDEFRDRFPEEHVRRWERNYRRLTMWNTWQGEGMGFHPEKPSFWWNSLKRLSKVPSALALAFYQPQLDADK